MTGDRKAPSLFVREPQLVEKVCFFKKSACSQSLSPNPFPRGKGCVCFVGSASCRAFGHTRPASVPGLSVGLPPLVQARMLVVSHTKPLHDAVAQMADDLYGGYAPATPFLYNQEVYRQSEAPSLFAREPDCISLTSGEILLVKSEDCNNCTVVLFIDEVLYIV